MTKRPSFPAKLDTSHISHDEPKHPKSSYVPKPSPKPLDLETVVSPLLAISKSTDPNKSAAIASLAKFDPLNNNPSNPSFETKRHPLVGRNVPIGADWSVAHRARLVEALQSRDEIHPMVVSAMLKIERHRFIDSALQAQAYQDTSLPIGQGQTISKPSVVARMITLMIEECDFPLSRVLEIGTGCGYQASVLSCVAKEVYTIERLKQLYDKAIVNVRPLLIPNLHMLFGDGMKGFPKGAPYSAIISAAGGLEIMSAWVDQLAVGGCIVAPTATQGHSGDPKVQSLMVLKKTPNKIVTKTFEAVHFVPLKSGVA
jgi:protein-L-isoaspartate(D-aspartate) O-methyltransferase